MNFFKMHKPLVYKYKPIYYDPKKELLKERQKQMEQSKDVEGNEEKKEKGKDYQPFIRRGTFREMADKNKYSRSSDIKKSNIRLLIILGILILIAYFLLV